MRNYISAQLQGALLYPLFLQFLFEFVNCIYRFNVYQTMKNKIGILQKEKGNKIPLGGALFIQYGKERTYIFGGSYKEYMNYPSQYLIQWTSIMDAVNDGCNIYNFYGIDGNLDKDGEMHGVYEFKRGFDGEVREYIGEFDLITSKFYYAVYKIAFKMYKLLKRVKIGNKEE